MVETIRGWVERYSDFGSDLACGRVGSFYDAVGASREQLRTVVAVCQRAAAALVSSCVPRLLNLAEAAF